MAVRALLSNSSSRLVANRYTTVIHAEFVPIGHSTSQAFRHIVSTSTKKTCRTPAVVSIPSESSSLEKTTATRLIRHDTWPLPTKRDSTGTWGGAGLLGVAETELERLKREQRAARELSKRVKQSLRGEIDSWEVEAGRGSLDDPWHMGYADSTSDEDAVVPGWSAQHSAPISDEEWGENWDYGGLPADLNELIVVDGPPLPWGNADEAEGKQPDGRNGWSAPPDWILTESHTAITLSGFPDVEINSIGSSMCDNDDQSHISKSMTTPNDNVTDSPMSSPQPPMCTPFSPELSPDPVPSTIEIQNSTVLMLPTRPNDGSPSMLHCMPRKRQYCQGPESVADRNDATENEIVADLADQRWPKRPFARRETA